MRALLAAVALATVPATYAAEAPAAAAVVVQPRPFGHVVGDVLTQRVLLARGGRPFEPSALPASTRLGVWFERRGARVETASDGTRWLAVDYQIVNAPTALATLRLPAWDLAGAGGAALHVPEWTLLAGPLAPRADADAASFDLRPDRPAPTVATGGLRRALGAAVAACALALLAWGAWLAWRNWRASANQPFAQAQRALQDDAEGKDAWRRLHQAFDRTAGEVLRDATLPRLFERAPHFATLRPDIERFYTQSAARFYGNDAAAAAGVSPRALCRALRRLERAHER